jgi:hypothetical protein
MKAGIENAKTTLEIYEKLEAGKTISVEEVETCWGFIADVYSGMEKKVEKILSLFRYGDRNLFKKISWIKVEKNTDAVYVGYETTRGNETQASLKRKFLSMSDKELNEWHQKSKKKNLASLILDIERTRLELTACKQSIRNSDKEIEELKNKLKKMKKR